MKPFVQRFDSGLRLNVHFHVLWLDGVHAHEPGRGAVEWCEHEGLGDTEVVRLVARVFSIDVLLCSQCGGTRRLLAAINGGLRFRFLETQVTNQLVADIVECGPRRRKPLRLSTLQTDANSSPVSR